MTTTNLAKYVVTKDVDVYRSDGNKIYFSGGSGRHLVYSFPLDVDSKEVSFSIHFNFILLYKLFNFVLFVRKCAK